MKKLCKRVCEGIDRYYIVFMAFIGLLIIVLNYNGTGMAGILSYYVDFKRIILSGFDVTKAHNHRPTFPMWGYGWVMILTENKLALLIMQMSFAIFSVRTFIEHVKSKVKPNTLLIFKGLLLIALPFYAFHSLRWPYSFAISLLILSIVYVDKAFEEDSWKFLVISGFLYGILLNFRSDYYMLPLLILGVIVYAKGFKVSVLKKAIVWFLVLYACLIPWAIYTHGVVGHFLLTSTNSGHVLFIGLGQLPNNPWGIEPKDTDPVMRKLLEDHFGKENIKGPLPSVLYESNKFLRKEFIKRVRENPAAYIKKCGYAFVNTLIKGVYPGEFVKGWCPNFNGKAPSFLSVLKEVKKSPVKFILTHKFCFFAFVMYTLSNIFMSRIFVFFAFLFFPIFVWESISKRDALGGIISGIILYQVAINVFAFHMPAYTSNIYFFLLWCFAYVVSLIFYRYKRS